MSTPAISGKSDGQPNSTEIREDSELVKTIQGLTKRLEKIERGEQSKKDRGIKALSEKIEEMRRSQAYLQEHKTPERAAREKAIDDLLDSRDVGASASTVTDERESLEYKNRIERRLKKKGVPRAEWATATAAVANQEFDDVDDAVDAASEAIDAYLTNKAKQDAPASPAGAVVPPGGKAPKPDLERQFKEEMLAARGQGAAAGRAIRKKYEEQGVETGKIVF